MSKKKKEAKGLPWDGATFMRPGDETRLVPRTNTQTPMTIREMIAATEQHQEHIETLADRINQRSGIIQWTERDAADWTASAEDWAEKPDTGSGQITPMTNIERVARAIVERLGFDPDRAAFRGEPRRVNYDVFLTPQDIYVRPLWTFFTVEADAAIAVLEI
jgi:hypothetical protein